MIVFWLSFFLLFYVYAGYFMALYVLTAVFGKKSEVINDEHAVLPSISVIIAAYNEELDISQRIENLLALNYPKDKLEILIASDGSSDQTVPKARQFSDPRLRILEYPVQRGRAAVHNDSVVEAKNEILVFSDAGSEFSGDFLRFFGEYFSRHNEVGFVVGDLVFRKSKSIVVLSSMIYWRFETALRRMENQLGILTTASGSCMAVRKHLWQDLGKTDDVDFVTPLQVISSGYKISYLENAIAYDDVPDGSSVQNQFRVRVRMTSKNLIGTLRAWSFKEWFRHPMVTWGLFSHKIFRWLFPYFFLISYFSCPFLLSEGLIYRFIFAAESSFVLLVFIGYMAELNNKKISVASHLFSFSVANAGMAIGVIKSLRGEAPAIYDNKENARG